MKKRSLAALICAAVLGLTGCSDSEKNTPAPAPTAVSSAPTETSTSSEPKADGGFHLKTLEEEKAEREAAKSSSSSDGAPGFSSPSSAPAEPVTVSGSTDDIVKVCGLVSEVEKSVGACIVDIDRSENPYDVIYDYGKDYDAFVAACDWSLVFDADYYIEQFPLLALQYHNDKALLLKHFQTVGIHEGRQGSANFNVGTYKKNCDSKVSKAFGENWEGYYFYYMLDPSEKYVITTEPDPRHQQKTVMTALQAEELENANIYRGEVGAPVFAFNSELAAFANYRAYVNAHDNILAHDWLDDDNIKKYIYNKVFPALKADSYTENECERYAVDRAGRTHYTCYRNSEPHYKTMVNAKFNAFGVSNSYASETNRLTMQLDTFARIK